MELLLAGAEPPTIQLALVGIACLLLFTGARRIRRPASIVVPQEAVHQEPAMPEQPPLEERRAA